MGYSIDRETAERLRSVDEQTLAEIIGRIAPAQAKALSGKTGMIKKKLGSLSAEEISRIVSGVKPELNEQVKQLLEGGGGSGR